MSSLSHLDPIYLPREVTINISHLTNHHLFRVSEYGWQIESSFPKANELECFGQAYEIPQSRCLHWWCNDAKLREMGDEIL